MRDSPMLSRRLTRIAVLTMAPGLCAAQLAGGGNASEPMYHYPRWSPDGARVVVVAVTPADVRLLVLSVASGEAHVIRPPNIRPMAADWTASGRISFVGDSAGVSNRSFVVDADGRHLGPFHRDSIESATRDSSILLFESHRNAGSSIFATDRRRLVARQLTRGFWAEQPSISPDEHHIVIEKRADPNRMELSEIVVMALDGSGQTTIASGTDPSWSPDGKTILFKSMGTDGVLWISVVDVAKRTTRRFARGVHPQWSPAGDRILYMSDEPGHNGVFIMTANGADPRCLTCSVSKK
jgi:Tol biopolymer transport system component